MVKKKKETIIKEVTKKLLGVLGITAEFEVVPGEDHTDVVIKTDEGGILIGYHGETLEALQLILSLAVAKEVGEFTRISLEIGDYKKQRIERLEQFVEEVRQRVLDEKKPVSLPDLKAWERRVVHVMLADDKDVVSESSGEGRDRALTVRPK